MKRRIVLITALFYTLGTIWVPVAAYSCGESGEAGLIAFLAMSPRSCYADSCCDDKQHALHPRIDAGVSCCDVSAQAAPENSQVLLPDPKKGQAGLLGETATRCDDSRLHTRIAPMLPPVSLFHASTNLPLLI